MWRFYSQMPREGSSPRPAIARIEKTSREAHQHDTQRQQAFDFTYFRTYDENDSRFALFCRGAGARPAVTMNFLLCTATLQNWFSMACAVPSPRSTAECGA